MMLDVVFITFNSTKWLGGLFESLNRLKYDKSKLNLFFFDNASTDGTVEKLKTFRKENPETFGSITIQKSDTNLGFGSGNNRAAALGKSDYIFFLNVDTSLLEDTFSQLTKAIEKDTSSAAALWELRQLPYEHPKLYDVLTGETSWSSGACFVIRRDVFETVGGFDESFFMYAEDVDLSWRVRMAGYKLRYVPQAAVNHFCYQTSGEIKPTQFIYSMIGNLHLRCKFGSKKEQFVGRTLLLRQLLLSASPFKNAKRRLIKTYWENRKILQDAKKWNDDHHDQLERVQFSFLGLDYEKARKGAFWRCAHPVTTPKVSIIIRTCGRPNVLREALISLRNQTYPNIEIVIAEDGPAISQPMILQEFSDLNIVYQATGKKVGRCNAGNLALETATGEYFNFLDDDDVFYADHVETLVSALEKNPGYKAAYALAFETPINVHSQNPYKYTITDYLQTLDQPFSRLELLYHNIFPIQSVMFSRTLYAALGGFNPELDVLEDWEFWIRYGLQGAFLYVPKITSQYRTPADLTIKQTRRMQLEAACRQLEKLNSEKTLHMSVAEFNDEIKQAPNLWAQIPGHYLLSPGEEKLVKAFRKAVHLGKKVARILKRLN